MNTLALINDQVLRDDEVKISALDLGLLRGYGAFEHFHTRNRTPFRLKRRLERLKASCEDLYIAYPNAIEEKTLALIEQAPWDEVRIRIIVTGGEESSLLIYAHPFFPYEFPDGIHAITTHHKRTCGRTKSLSYAPAIQAQREAESQGAQEALYLDDQKRILEGTLANFFAIKEGTLITSDAPEVLLGITREAVLELSPLPVEFRGLSLSEIPSFEEAFLTSSNKNIVPLLSIDRMPIGHGSAGPQTKELIQFLDTLMESECACPQLID